MSLVTFRVWALVAGLAALTVAASARAQDASPDVAARAELLRRAQEASGRNNHAEALDLAERAARIQMTTSLRAFIAYEQAQLGQIVEGLSNAEQCTREVNNNPTLPQRQSIQSTCRQIIQQLEPRIAHVTVQVTNPPDGTRIMVAGHELNSALYGIPYIVTPGTVAIEADAPGRAHFQTSVEVQAGGTQAVTVTLLELQHRAATTQTSQPDNGGASRSNGSMGNTSATSATQSDRAAGGGLPIIPIVVGVAGAAIVGVGGFLWVQADGYNNAGLQADPGAMATNLTRANDLSSSAAFRDASIACFAIGGVAVAAGVILGLLSRGHGHASATGFLVPVTGGAVMGVGGAL